MTRFTPAYSAFVERLREINLLRSKAAFLARNKLAIRHGAEINALCRGSVVLLSSHIEAYIKELGENTLDAIYDKKVCRSRIAPKFFYHMSRESIDSIRSSEGPEAIAKSMRHFVQREAALWESTGGFPIPVAADLFNSGFANPKFDKIKSYLARFGYDDFRRDFYRDLTRGAQPVVTALDQIVDARNAIAHGDPGATKTPVELKEMIEAAKLFCRTTDRVFATWCRQHLCNIRA